MSRFEHVEEYSIDKLVDCVNHQVEQGTPVSGGQASYRVKLLMTLEEKGVDISEFCDSHFGHRTFSCNQEVCLVDGKTLKRRTRSEKDESGSN